MAWSPEGRQAESWANVTLLLVLIFCCCPWDFREIEFKCYRLVSAVLWGVNGKVKCSRLGQLVLRRSAKWQEISENTWVSIKSNLHGPTGSCSSPFDSLPSLFLSLLIRPTIKCAFPTSHHLVSLDARSKQAHPIQAEGETSANRWCGPEVSFALRIFIVGKSHRISEV